jgi:integrase
LFLQTVKPVAGKGIWYSESGAHGLRLYVGASGKKTWYVNYRRVGASKLSQYKIGDADLYSPPQARDAAREFLAAVVRGETPWEKPESKDGLTLGKFVEDIYAQWARDHRKSGNETVAMIQSAFASLAGKRIDEISVADVERWRGKKRAEKGSKASTLNRAVAALKAALNWAVKRGIIEGHLLGRLERLREDDSDTKIRYLLPEERERLFVALDAREDRLRTGRESHNGWLDERERERMPDIKDLAFADYLKPMVIVSLNTGIRRGSLYRLLWSDVNFRERNLTVRAAIAKSGRDIQIPMNEVLTVALEAWKNQTGGDEDGLVFPSPRGGGVFDNCKRAWEKLLKEAGITKFRWHDMRHDFASQLVMKGADLNTVRELLGHADMKMTLRYAHLAPKVKRAAVELLSESSTPPLGVRP